MRYSPARVEKHQWHTPGSQRIVSQQLEINLLKMMNYRTVFFIAFSLLLIHSCNNKDRAGYSERTSNDAITKKFTIEVYDSIALAWIDPNATIEILAKGFWWSEGPLWIDELQSVVFSDVPANKIYQWNEKDSLSIYLESAGHSGEENKDSDKGPNGLILNQNKKLLICQHGNRQIALMDADLTNPQGQFTSIAAMYEGKKLNSPNDLALDLAGNIYFTDPPYGQPGNKTGEIGINGVFKVNSNKEVSLLIDSLSWPNGIALSLDQKSLYINQSDPQYPVLYRYDITTDGSLENGMVLFDFSEFAKTAIGLPDGLKIHKSGNIVATGPGGVHIISPEGNHLGLIGTAKATSNCAFDTDHKYLYMTTTDMLIRVELLNNYNRII
jgi:gluconolactonase